MKILVADDDRVISLLVCSILRKQGHEAVPAFTVAQALALAGEVPGPALIILDMNMPGGTGLEVLAELRRSGGTASIPVIVQTGSVGDAERAEARALGAADVLSKPVVQQALLAAIARVTGAAA